MLNVIYTIYVSLLNLNFKSKMIKNANILLQIGEHKVT